MIWLRALVAAIRPVPSEERAREGPHAQFGEDRILERIFTGQGDGYCVEVGAYDGVTGSATYLFEQKGWHCLLVEPIPALAEAARHNRRSPVVKAAVSDREGDATFYVAEHVEQMSTLDLSTGQRRWIEQVGGAITPITVPKRTLDSILLEAALPRIDFMTIDVEGHELEVLRGFSLDRHRPRVVILEENRPAGAGVAQHMAQNGYVNFRRTGVNDWYAHESDSELARPQTVRQVRLEKALRRRIDPLKGWLVRLLPASVRRILGA